jgi:predicted Zn-dependent peptidase
MSLWYTCRSSMIGQKGLMSVYAGIATENKEITQNAILEQLALCQKGDFTDDDVAMAKQSLCNVYRALTDRPSSMERFYLNRILAQDGNEISDFISAISAVTREEIIESANKVTADTIFFLEGIHDEKGGEADA